MRPKIIYLKTAFRILPFVTVDQSMHLLVEVGAEGISFLYFTKEPLKAEGVLMCQFDKNLSALQTAAAIRNLISDEASLQQSFSSVNILHNVKESTLVPDNFHHPMMKEEILTTLFGSDRQTVIFDEHIRNKNITNIYRVAKPVVELLRESFPFSSAYHTNTLLVPQLRGGGVRLYCIVSQQTVKIVLLNEEVLQLTQQFCYQTAVDVVYHLLNAAERYEFPPENVELILSGMIDESSNLYKELYKYFLQISFAELPSGIAINDGFDEHPPHFFQHLILLSACV